MKTYDYKSILAIAAVLLAVAVLAVVFQRPFLTMGSVQEGQEYKATSTRNFNGVALANGARLKGNGDNCVAGSLAQVMISASAAPGAIRFWDATTTNASLRAAQYASSTVFITEINTLTATGTTLVLDASFGCGLIYEFTGTAATATIMWR